MAETGWMPFDELEDRFQRASRFLRVLIPSEQQRMPKQHIAGDRVSRRRGVVEKILRPCDQFLVIDRCVVEAAVLLVGESRPDLLEQTICSVEISTLVCSFIRTRPSPRYAGVIFEHSGNRSVPNQMPFRIDAGDQKLRILSHHIFITVERQARLGERGEHPAIPSGENFFVASGSHSLLADSIEMTLSALD